MFEKLTNTRFGRWFPYAVIVALLILLAKGHDEIGKQVKIGETVKEEAAVVTAEDAGPVVEELAGPGCSAGCRGQKFLSPLKYGKWVKAQDSGLYFLELRTGWLVSMSRPHEGMSYTYVPRFPRFPKCPHFGDPRILGKENIRRGVKQGICGAGPEREPGVRAVPLPAPWPGFVKPEGDGEPGSVPDAKTPAEGEPGETPDDEDGGDGRSGLTPDDDDTENLSGRELYDMQPEPGWKDDLLSLPAAVRDSVETLYKMFLENGVSGNLPFVGNDETERKGESGENGEMVYREFSELEEVPVPALVGGPELAIDCGGAVKARDAGSAGSAVSVIPPSSPRAEGRGCVGLSISGE
jgi:hypothetical protein